MFIHSNPFSITFSLKRVPLSSAQILHFYSSNHSLWLGFLPHKINTRINAHSNAKERRAKERRRRPTIAESGFSIYPLVVRRHRPHQSPVSKTTFLNLFSLRRVGKITGGKTKKNLTKKEGGFHRHHHVFFCDEHGTNLARNVQRFRKWIQSNRDITRRTDESANAFETVDE